MRLTHPYLLLLLGSLFCLTPLSAQTFQIGDADGVNSQSQFPCPYGDLYEGMRAQYLYTAAELTAKGASAGFISTVGFLVGDANNAALENFNIRLSATSSTSLSTTAWEPAGTLCYTVPLWQAVGGQNLHLLQNQFYWDGSSNLLVEVCFNPTDPTSGNFANNNARVAWSRNLPFNGSHTFAADDESAICATNTTASIGFESYRPVLLLRFSCEPPTNLTLTSLTSTSASVQFTASPDANSYVWELGLAGFSPGTNTALFGGVTPNTTLTFTNLAALTLYDVYVRANCGSTNSTWAGPFSFKTLAGCGNAYYDSGGFLGAYQNNENRVEVLCPDSATHVMIIEFAAISLAAGDTLRVYNGNGTTWPLLAAFSGTSVSIPPLSATTVSGCLTVQFVSDSAEINVGWLADLSCGRPDSCFNVLEPEAYPVAPFYDRMGVRWRPMFDAKEYQWRAGVRPYLPSQPTALKDTVDVPQTLVAGLTESTLYDFWVRVMCKSGDSSQWIKVEFFTPPNCNSGVLNCGNSTFQFISIGTGIYQTPVCNLPVPGKEKIIRFTAPNTRNYTFEVLSTNNTGTYVGYFYKPVSLGCGPDDWQCIEDFNQPGTQTFGPLVAGREYYIRFEPQNPNILVSQTVHITGCSPENDEALNAIDLAIDQACAGNVYSNEGASISGNEPIPDADPGDGTIGRWQNGIERTVWFRFAAPASGTVKISTENVPQGSNFDTQIALYKATDPADYTTFTLLESDEDSGEAGLGFNAELTYTGLQPGTTYYIQVDDYGISAGTFCIAVQETGPRTLDSNCGAGYSASGVDGTQPDGDHWYNIYTVPGPFEVGDLVAAIKPGPQNLGTVWCQINNIDSIPVDNYGQEYMPAYFNFRSQIAPVGPFSLRLFFYNSEFEALKAKADLPTATIEDLNATHYRGPLQDCLLPENSYADHSKFELITAVDGVSIGTSGTFYVELEVDSMGEVGVHLLAAPLPLELKVFEGKVSGAHNLLEWETLLERQVQWHIVERSADNLHWTEIGRKPGSLQLAAQPIRYALEDRNPLPRGYYRLRSIDADGRTAYSSSILLSRPDEAFGIAAAFPSPTSGMLTLQYFSPREWPVRMQVLDFIGRVVLEQNAESTQGLNQWPLDLSALPAGTYVVVLSADTAGSSSLRVSKK